MRRSWRVYAVAIGAAVCWLAIAFVVVPHLGDALSFNKVSNTTPANGAEADQASSQVPSRDFRGNVYHIVFDSYQSEAYQYFVDKTPELKQLPVTYYPNFRSSRPATYFSLAELFASDFYTPTVSAERWHDAAIQNGMMAYLANEGVRLHLYIAYPDYCYGGVSTVCQTLGDLKKGLLSEVRVRQTSIDLWFLKLIPTSLRRELTARFAPNQDEDAPDGDSFSDWNYGFSIFDAISPSKTPGNSDNPYFSMRQFMQLLDEEASRPATGQYVFLHAILPHGPFKFDRECTYAQRAIQAQQDRYLGQVQCANKLMTLLVNKLASLGRLDNSLIVFQADHGHNWHPADLGVLHEYHPLDVSVPRVDPEQGDSSTWPSEMIEARASALLLVKFPGQSAASRSDKPVEMIDIAPTILRYFDIDVPGSMRGIPIQDMPDSPARERFFFASNYIPQLDNPKVFSRYRYVDGKWVFDENIRGR
jgi:hypothetical protein